MTGDTVPIPIAWDLPRILARRLATILPMMTLAAALEPTCLPRVAGLTGARTTVVTTRPCRARYQTISAVGLIDGGHIPRPGRMLRAHHGMLFLDARPECRRYVLEGLRQPFEESVLYIQSHGRLEFQCFGYVCGLCCGHQFAQPYARGVSGLSGFARAHRASANSANASLELECL
jgi:Magnesium chelatase, subunit ChlI